MGNRVRGNRVPSKESKCRHPLVRPGDGGVSGHNNGSGAGFDVDNSRAPAFPPPTPLHRCDG